MVRSRSSPAETDLQDNLILGLAGYLAGVSVAVKQAMPDHILYRSPMGKITNSNIPLACFLLTFVMWAIGLVEGSYCTMFGSGLVISWIYLRFYQLHANGTRGDSAESFCFASFFPNVMQPPINACFALLVRLRICKKPIRRYDMGAASTSGPAISISLPGVDNHDTERRRQIALKALSDRLSKTPASPEAANWPSLDDEAETTQLLSSQSPVPAVDIPTSVHQPQTPAIPGSGGADKSSKNGADTAVKEDVLINVNPDEPQS